MTSAQTFVPDVAGTAAACPEPPWSEPDRVAALLRYNVLDMPPDAEFDDITRVVALVCKVPVAIVSLLADTRQFFVAEVGVGVREMPLDTSFCARAILLPGLTVVRDARLDPRFNANPLVTGPPHLRFYAGAPLVTPDGLPIGTVCVLDTEPRPEGLSAEQSEIIQALARQAMTILELRRALVAGDLLSRELSHRIQNLFTVVGGLVSLSARGRGGDARAFAEDVRQRINALAQATNLVRPPDADGAALPRQGTVQGLLRVLLAPYDQGRVAISGDDAPLGSQAATSLALVVHEMATNAMKYGALSTPAGRVDIRCEDLSDDAFALTWRERGGPRVLVRPSRQGFGTAITTRSMTAQLGGDIGHEWAEEGLTVRLAMPRSRLAH